MHGRFGYSALALDFNLTVYRISSWARLSQAMILMCRIAPTLLHVVGKVYVYFGEKGVGISPVPISQLKPTVRLPHLDQNYLLLTSAMRAMISSLDAPFFDGSTVHRGRLFAYKSASTQAAAMNASTDAAIDIIGPEYSWFGSKDSVPGVLLVGAPGYHTPRARQWALCTPSTPKAGT